MSQRDQSTVYRFLVKGHIDAARAELIGGLSVVHVREGVTMLTGPVKDPAALYGIIVALRDMGLELLDAQRVGSDTSAEDVADGEED